MTSKVGTSLYGVHYCGRAVDIAQTLHGVGKTKGYDEKKIRAAGWKTDAELDHAPG